MCHNLTVHCWWYGVKGWGFWGEMHPRLVFISITSMSTLLDFVESILEFLWAWTLVETHPKLIARCFGHWAHSSCNSRQIWRGWPLLIIKSRTPMLLHFSSIHKLYPPTCVQSSAIFWLKEVTCTSAEHPLSTQDRQSICTLSSTCSL